MIEINVSERALDVALLNEQVVREQASLGHSRVCRNVYCPYRLSLTITPAESSLRS